MDSRFKIFQEGCVLSIYGLEQNGDEYGYECPDYPTSYRRYKYSESVTLNAIFNISSTDDETLAEYEIIPHDGRVDQSNFLLKQDGLYKISHIIIPTKEYVDRFDEDELYKYIYYYDNDLFFKYDTVSKLVTEIDLIEILEIYNDESHSVVRSDTYTFSTCHLEQCIFNVFKNDIKKKWGTCVKKSEASVLKDLNWMALYVMRYLIDLQQYYEAQRIYETISSCGNICTKTTIDNGCGCS